MMNAIKIMLPGIIAFCIVITGCRTSPSKESPCVGLMVKDSVQDAQKSAGPAPAVDVPLKDGSGRPAEISGTENGITEADQGMTPPVRGLSKSDQIKLLEIAGTLNTLRKNIFSILESISSMDLTQGGKDDLKITAEIESALAETRHYMDHESELMYTIPYIKDAYFIDMVKNRLDGIVKTREIINLYKTNLEALYKKMGKRAAVFSPNNTLKQFELSLEQLDSAKELLELYVNQ